MEPLIAFIAGIVSILSPCVLPLLPAIVATSTGHGHGKLRPLAIVGGLAITFVTFGIFAGAFGEIFLTYSSYLYAISAGIIVFMGIYLLYDLHMPWEGRINVLNRFAYKTHSISSNGVMSGLVLGMALGIVWMPCTGPILSVILTMVAIGGSVISGAYFLSIYSLGFAVPMLAIAYSSSAAGTLVSSSKKMIFIRKVSGLVLLAVGVYLVFPYLPN
jgi:cytochrome c-type biogenesis protein